MSFFLPLRFLIFVLIEIIATLSLGVAQETKKATSDSLDPVASVASSPKGDLVPVSGSTIGEPLSSPTPELAPEASVGAPSPAPVLEPSDASSVDSNGSTPSPSPLVPLPTDPSATTPSNPETSSQGESETTADAISSSGSAEVAPTPAPYSTESIEKRKQELKVRYTQVRIQVEKDSAVIALKNQANTATTDEGKRQALRAYYELLFAKMKKVDPSIAERCDKMQGAYLRRLERLSIEPSIPLSAFPDSK